METGAARSRLLIAGGGDTAAIADIDVADTVASEPPTGLIALLGQQRVHTGLADRIVKEELSGTVFLFHRIHGTGEDGATGLALGNAEFEGEGISQPDQQEEQARGDHHFQDCVRDPGSEIGSRANCHAGKDVSL